MGRARTIRGARHVQAGFASACALLCVGAASAQDGGPVFDVQAIQVRGNTVLSPASVEEAVYPYMGSRRTADDMEAARAALQARFEEAGFPTVSVQLPEQNVDSGVIVLQVVEQRIAAVEVQGTKDIEGVLARAPSVVVGAVPNFPALQRDLVRLNATADRRVTPEFIPGEDASSLKVRLQVEETYPLHGAVELNNRGSAATTALRASASLRYDDLWDRGDSVGVSVQTAPERPEDGTVYSANYSMRLPGRWLLAAYVVKSDSDLAVVGDINVIGSGELAGVRLIAPLPAGEGFYQSLSVGVDYKNFEENLTLGADRDSVPIEYWPFLLGWRGDWIDDDTRSSVSVTATGGFRGLGDGPEDFDRKRFEAEPNFFYVRGDASQIQTYENNLQLYAATTFQWAAEPLISNEQFGLGGLDSVRGYYETEVTGDYGAAFQAELRTPSFASRLGSAFDEARLHLFADTGFAGIYEALPGQEDLTLLVSVGLGGRVKLFRRVNGAFDLAFPLLDGPDKPNDEITTRFRLYSEF